MKINGPSSSNKTPSYKNEIISTRKGCHGNSNNNNNNCNSSRKWNQSWKLMGSLILSAVFLVAQTRRIHLGGEFMDPTVGHIMISDEPSKSSWKNARIEEESRVDHNAQNNTATMTTSRTFNKEQEGSITNIANDQLMWANARYGGSNDISRARVETKTIPLPPHRTANSRSNGLPSSRIDEILSANSRYRQIPLLPYNTKTNDQEHDQQHYLNDLLLLSVPFYIYPGWGIPSLPNGDLYLGKSKFNISTIDPPNHIVPRHSILEYSSKHTDDYLLLMAAKNHPMRVYDPSKATLFLLSAPMNMFIERDKLAGIRKPMCLAEEEEEDKNNTTSTTPNNNFKYRICNKRYIQLVDKELGRSKWFQRYKGLDHIVIASHWMWTTNWDWMTSKWELKYIFQCNVIDFEGQLYNFTLRHDRITFPSYYVGKRCTATTTGSPSPQGLSSSGSDGSSSSSISSIGMEHHNKTQDFAMITTLKRTDKNITFEDRVNICNWVQKESNNYTMDACGKGRQCPALSQAKFGFHAVGDTPGSNRLMDTLLSYTIPIFTRHEQYDVLPNWIDWDEISYFADISNKDVFLKQLQQITSDELTYQRKLQNIQQNYKLFDYETIVPFDTYMYMFQITLLPESKHINITSPYSALQLP